MTDYYTALCVEPNASVEEIEAAYQEQLAARRAKRQKNADLHQAIAVLGDPVLRTAYDLKRRGSAVSGKLVAAKDTAVDSISDVIAEIDVAEVAKQASEVGLKGVVLLSGAVARIGEATTVLSRRVQVGAARRLNRMGGES